MTKLNHRVQTFEYSFPDGFVDDSNANDVCASLYSAKLGLKVFIDHLNPIKREETSYPRFAIYNTNEYGEIEDSINDLVFESEDWRDILTKIKGASSK